MNSSSTEEKALIESAILAQKLALLTSNLNSSGKTPAAEGAFERIAASG